MVKKKIFVEFNNSKILVDDIQGIAFELHDANAAKYVKDNRIPVPQPDLPNRYNLPQEKYDISFYAEDFSTFGAYQGCRSIIANDHSVVFMYERIVTY